MNPIPDEALWRLRKSDGYMDLRMWSQAQAELDRVPRAQRDTPLCRQLHLRLALEQHHWAEAVVWAEQLRRQEPEQAGHWIQLAYATRRAAGLTAARRVLLEAHEHFPDEAIIHFNLACYACQLGETDEARLRLHQAETLEPACRKMARMDRDLEALWSELDAEPLSA